MIDSYPGDVKAGILTLRNLIYEVAKNTEGVGMLEETLKWGQPAYLTSETKSGSTIRLGIPKTGGFAIYTHCQTTIISEFRDMFPRDFIYEGNRAIHFLKESDIVVDALTLLIRRALTYHLKR